MKLEAKSKNINKLNLDLLPEFVVSSLLNEGINQKNILAIFDGNLKRKWSKDIDYSEIENFENSTEAISIHLNRTGIYDSLPEALFHQTADDKNARGTDMAKDSMRLKAEEKQTRLFFKPLENELFFQSVFLKNNETKLYQNLFADTLNGLIPGFWKIDDRIPSKYVSRLIKLIPYTHKITGNLKLTAEALEFILNEQVNIELDLNVPDKIIFATNSNNEGKLGEGILGQDFIMGHNVTGFIGQLIFEIGPLKNTAPMDFHENGPANILIETFIGYFTAMEYDVTTILLLEKEKSKFHLSDKREGAEPSNLGFNTVL